MASIRCPLCQGVSEMRRYHTSPYRRTNARIAAAIRVEYPHWNEEQGFCRNCAKVFKAKLEQRERIAEEILVALSELPPLEKKIFVFYHYRGLKTDEIAAKLRLNQEGVREALTRAAKLLLLKLQPHIAMVKTPTRPVG